MSELDIRKSIWTCESMSQIVMTNPLSGRIHLVLCEINPGSTAAKTCLSRRAYDVNCESLSNNATFRTDVTTMGASCNSCHNILVNIQCVASLIIFETCLN